MPEIESATAMLVRLASLGDEAGLATALSHLDTATLADALERLALAHEAAALAAGHGNASQVVIYRTALLRGIQEVTGRASEALPPATSTSMTRPNG